MNRQRPNILLVEDDLNLGFVVQDNLKFAGYNVTLEKDGESAYKTFFAKDFDLCILDVMLPLKDGFSLAEDMRKLNEDIPILFLTAKSMPEDKVRGFKAGGDDYLTKPFNIEELTLRLEAILKRTRTTSSPKQKDAFEIGAFSFEFRNMRLLHGEEEKALTKKEANLLRLLCLHRDSVLERDMALNLIWGSDDYFLGRSMDVFITKLRKYLRADPRIQIQNVHGVGFRLVVNEEE
ncbi:MAG: response regulator transcription factor [Salibacteraceae bacterium]